MPAQTQTQTPISKPETQVPQIRFNIKTYIENEDDVRNIEYVKTLLKEVREIVENSIKHVEEVIMNNIDTDVCSLPSVKIVLGDIVKITANGNVYAGISESCDYDLDYDLVLSEYNVDIVKNDKIIEKAKLYIALSGWNVVCDEENTVRKLLEKDDYNVEISIIYIPHGW